MDDLNVRPRRQCAAALLYDDLPQWQTNLIGLTQKLNRYQDRWTMTSGDSDNRGVTEGLVETCICSDLEEKLKTLASIIEGLSGTIARIEEKEKESEIEMEVLETRLCRLEMGISSLGQNPEP